MMAPKPPPKLPPMVQHESSSTGMIVKKFKLGEVLGKGSAGTVYKSLNLVTGDVFAIKQVPLRNIPKADLGKIMHEINLLNHLDHVNIVKYVDNIKTKDHLNIVLEFVENGSLANTVKKFGSLPESLIAIYIEQVLQGLCFLHSQGVIHRDIKGANILTTKEGHVKLADFGVARRLGEAAIEGRGQDDVAGTPYWMAPEVIEMSPPSTASDIWGVGATIIELLTGVPPYFELSALPALFRIVQDPHPPIPEGISPALRDFLLQCFRKDPSTRLTARKLLEHQWIRTSVARREGREEGQDWSVVVERTLELHEAARKERKSRGRGAKRSLLARSSGQAASRGALACAEVANGRRPAGGADNAHGVQRQMARSLSANAVSNLQTRKSSGGNDELFGITHVAPSRSGSEVAADDLDVTESSDCMPSSPMSSVATAEVSRAAVCGDKDRHHQGVDMSNFVQVQDDNGGLADIELPTVAAVAHTGLAGPSCSVGQAAIPDATRAPADLARYMETGDGTDLLDLELPENSPLVKKVGRPQVVRPEDMRRADWGGPASAHMRQAAGLTRFVESQQDDELLELDMDEGFDERGGEQLQSLLQRKMRVQEHGMEQSDSDGDEQLFDVTEVQDDELKVDEAALVEAELLKLMAQLHVEGDEHLQLMVCQDLEHLLRNRSESKTALMVHHQVLPLLEMLDHSSDLVVVRVLRLVHEVMTDRHKQSDVGEYTGGIALRQPLVDRMCTVGLVHRLLEQCRRDVREAGEEARMVQQQAALVLHSVCWGRQPHHVQMLIACQGIPALVALLSADAPVNHVALDCLWAVINVPSPAPKLDLCRLIARGKAAVPLARLLERAFADSARQGSSVRDDLGDDTGWVNLSWQQADRVASILLLFSQGDGVVKADLADDAALGLVLAVIRRGYAGLPRKLQGAYVKLLQGLRHLSGEPSALVPLQRAGACVILVPLLSGIGRTKNLRQLASQVQSQAMFALYNLCKVSKERQEQAAIAGVVPYVQRIIESDSPLRQLAIPILCDLAHAGTEPRAELWRHDAVLTLVKLLRIKYWQTMSLNAIANWIASSNEPQLLEDVLARQENIEALVECVIDAETNSMASMLSPLLRILQQSEKLNQLLGHSGLVAGLLMRMQHPEAVVRKSIIEIIQSLYAVSTDPRAFIMAHGLLEVFEQLISVDEARLVQEQAKLLLKAMYINVVL